METDVLPAALELFRNYLDNQEAFPYVHQATAIKKIMAGENLTLVAGTAAGKTLALAIPLFLKLITGRVNKVMFLYPTVALLEDQRQVMDKLAVQTGIENEVGQIRGGLSRSRLLQELNKKIILATPDATYWFFRKNIKYSHLLIYGLTQVDEFVVNEAHLFYGLILQNLSHFFERIFCLQKQYLLRPPARLHVLTATPREDLKFLSAAPAVTGKSKCSEVKVNFFNCGFHERAAFMEQAIQEAIHTGTRKILVICNSALQAHRLFRGQSTAQKSGAVFRPDDYLQFGRIKKGDMEKFLAGRGFSEEVLSKPRLYALEEVELHLDDFKAVQVKTGAQEVCQALLAALTALKNQIMQVIYLSFKNALKLKKGNPFAEGLSREVLFYNLSKRQPVLLTLFKIICPNVPGQCPYPELKSLVNTGFSRVLADLEDEVSENFTGYLFYPGLPELSSILKALNFSPDLLKIILTRFVHNFAFKTPAIFTKKGTFPGLKEQYVYLKFLPVYFKEDSGAVINALREELCQQPSFARFIKMNHVATWKGTDYPLIVYSGSMSRCSRQGLINLFDRLEKAVLISTAAVEVGVDFTAQALITEECPAQSFLQRFGRVGRTGNGAKVYLLTGGATYGKIADQLENKVSLSREGLTNLINESFSTDLFLKNSDLVRAAHYIITEQLGLVGKKLNNNFPVSPAVSRLAAALKETGINPAYGLRSTLLQISLKDEGVSRDPFYLLRYIDNNQLKVSDSPFEVAPPRFILTNSCLPANFAGWE